MKTMWTLTNSPLLHSEPDPGAAAPVPAPAATPEPVPAAEPSGGETDVPSTDDADFVALSKAFDGEDDDLGEEPAAPVPAPAAVQPVPTPPPGAVQPAVPPVAGVPPAPAAPPTAPPAPVPGAASQQATPPVAPAPAAPAASTEPITPDTVAAAYKQYEATVMPQLEALYALTPEQATALDENPAAFIPKLAAQIHYKAQVAAYTGIMSQVPMIISSILERHRAVEKAEGQFFARWPDLNKPEHSQAVETGIQAFRNANKSAKTEELIEKAGLMIMLSLGLNPQPNAGAPPPAPVLPAPARPAGTGGQGQARPSQGGAVNIFEAMADEMRTEELES